MRKTVFIYCLLATAALYALPDRPEQQKSLFCYAESQGLGGQMRCLYDLFVFQDGTQAFGVIESISPLSYPFGTVAIPINQVRLISSNPLLGKIKVMTTNGQVYVANMKNEEISFIEYSSNATTSRRSERRSVRADTISFIVTKPRGNLSVDPSDSLFYLTFTSGHTIPVQMTGSAMTLIDGLNQYAISSKDVIVNREEEETNLSLAFAKNSSFAAALPVLRETFNIPWKDVSHIQREQKQDKHQPPHFITDITKSPKAGNIGLTQTSDRKPHKISGMSIAVVGAEFPEAVKELDPMFHDQSSLNIPTGIVFAEEEPQSVLMVNPDIVEKEDFLAMIEDFDLEDWEQDEDEEDKEKEEEEDDREEFIFTSRGSAMKTPFLYQVEEDLVSTTQIVEVKKSAALKPSHSDVSPQLKRSDGMVYVTSNNPYSRGFYIKPKKITNREYSRFVKAVNYKAPTYWIHGKIPAEIEDDPVVDITYKDALLFAVWSGKRLPRREELRLASRDSNVMMDLEDDLYEWTQTPSQGSRRPVQAKTSSQKRMQKTFSSAHFVYGSRQEIPMQNDNHNSYTGFRLVTDAH